MANEVRALMSNWLHAPYDMVRQTSDLLKLLSDDRSFAIFKTIAIYTDRSKQRVEREMGKEKVEGIDSRNIISHTKLSQKAFNEKLLCLIKTGLVSKRKRKIEIQSNNTNVANKGPRYMLTEPGWEVYDACATLKDAINDKPKLQALESLFERSNLQQNNAIAEETKRKLIDTVIDNHKVKDCLLTELPKC